VKIVSDELFLLVVVLIDEHLVIVALAAVFVFAPASVKVVTGDVKQVLKLVHESGGGVDNISVAIERVLQASKQGGYYLNSSPQSTV
jgi:hypothetical protein